mgnify:CR=1 FL=1
MFQSASVAFDLSMEEIWVPYLAGATLYVATPEVLADIEKLPSLLTEKKVSVIDTVPTLLSVLPADIPGLRLILLDGRQRVLHIEAEPEFNEHGHCTGYTGIVQDVTDRRQAEDSIRRLANNDALTSLPNRRQQ